MTPFSQTRRTFEYRLPQATRCPGMNSWHCQHPRADIITVGSWLWHRACAETVQTTPTMVFGGNIFGNHKPRSVLAISHHSTTSFYRVWYYNRQLHCACPLNTVSLLTVSPLGYLAASPLDRFLAHSLSPNPSWRSATSPPIHQNFLQTAATYRNILVPLRRPAKPDVHTIPPVLELLLQSGPRQPICLAALSNQPWWILFMYFWMITLCQ